MDAQLNPNNTLCQYIRSAGYVDKLRGQIYSWWEMKYALD